MNIKKFQKKSNKTIKEVANELKIPFSTYNNYLIETREPNIETLIKLANYFNVTIDELVGRKKEETVLTEKKALLDKIEQLNEIECKKLNIFADGLILNRISEQKERTFKLIKDNNKGE